MDRRRLMQEAPAGMLSAITGGKFAQSIAPCAEIGALFAKCKATCAQWGRAEEGEEAEAIGDKIMLLENVIFKILPGSVQDLTQKLFAYGSGEFGYGPIKAKIAALAGGGVTASAMTLTWLAVILGINLSWVLAPAWA